jgi:hypothetical protein
MTWLSPSAACSVALAAWTSVWSVPASSLAGWSRSSASPASSSPRTSPADRSTATFAGSIGPPLNPLTSSLAAFRASQSARPAGGGDRPTTAGSGPSSLVPFAHFDHATCSWRTSQGSFDLGATRTDAACGTRHLSKRSLRTWPRSVTWDGLTAFLRRPWALRTRGTACGSWPSPKASDHRPGHASRAEPSRRSNLNDRVLWPTLRVSQGGGDRERWGNGPTLGDMVRGWPTLLAKDADAAGGIGAAMRRTRSPSLTNAIRWPTLLDRDRRGPSRGKGAQGSPPLAQAVSGLLNPEWCELLMGFPPGWTDIGGQLPPARSTNGNRRAPLSEVRSPTERDGLEPSVTPSSRRSRSSSGAGSSSSTRGG